MKRILFYSLILFLAYACKKKEFPQNQIEDPAFYLQAEVNGIPVQLTAGNNGYYMYSEFTQDSSGLYTFVSSMRKNNCSSLCPISFKIEINDNLLSQISGACNISNSLQNGNYSYADTASLNPYIYGYKVNYTSSFNNTPVSYNWNFGDGNSSSLANPSHTFSSTGNYLTCLQINDGSSSESICNPIKVNHQNVCRTTVLVNNITDKTIQFGNQSSGSGPFTFRWDFGDGNYSALSNPTHTYDSEGIYFVKLKVTDNLGDTAVHHYNVNTNQSMKPAPNFRVQSISKLLSYQNMFSKIKFSYVNESGVIYTGHIQTQPNESIFKVESVVDYESNEQGKKTKKIKITFSCTLYNGANSIAIKNGEAVLAVAYPD